MSAKVRTCVRHFPGLTSPVNEIEPTTSGVDHQRSNRLSHEVNRELVVGIKSQQWRNSTPEVVGSNPTEVKDYYLTAVNPISFTGLVSPGKCRTQALTLALSLIIKTISSHYMGATRLTHFVVQSKLSLRPLS